MLTPVLCSSGCPSSPLWKTKTMDRKFSQFPPFNLYVWHFMLFLSIHSSPWRRYLLEPNLLGLDYLYPPNEENATSSDSNHRRRLQAWTTAQSSPHWPLCLCLLYVPEKPSDPCFSGIFTQILQAAALCVQPAQHGAPVPAHSRLATAAGMKGI